MGRPGQSCRPGDNCCIVRRFGYRLQVAAINCRVRGASENRIAVPPDHEMGALWMLALCTARQESELLGLSWSHVAWERNEIRVERQLKRLHGRWYPEAIKTGDRGASTARARSDCPRSPSVCCAAIRSGRTRHAWRPGPSWSETWLTSCSRCWPRRSDEDLAGGRAAGRATHCSQPASRKASRRPCSTPVCHGSASTICATCRRLSSYVWASRRLRSHAFPVIHQRLRQPPSKTRPQAKAAYPRSYETRASGHFVRD